MRRAMVSLGVLAVCVLVLTASAKAELIFVDNLDSLSAWSTNGNVTASAGVATLQATTNFTTLSNSSGMTHAVSTAGYENVLFRYQIKVEGLDSDYGFGSADHFLAGWKYTGSSLWNISQDLSVNSAGWITGNVSLPDNVTSDTIDLGFNMTNNTWRPIRWLFGGSDRDYGRVDWVEVSGDKIMLASSAPEPASLSLFGLGLMGLLGRKRDVSKKA